MQKWLADFFNEEKIVSIVTIPQAGSDRVYERITTESNSYVLCRNNVTVENKAFIYLSNLFHSHGVNAPEVVAHNEECTAYLQTDLGSEDLLQKVIQLSHTEDVRKLYEKSLAELVSIQLNVGKIIDYRKLSLTDQFDYWAIIADLNYFKYYFLDRVGVPYSKLLLAKEFDLFSKELECIEPRGFMYRDFQGRNILIKEGKPGFIDFQGGMKGPVSYDLASLLWQAKAKIPANWKREFLDLYMEEVGKYLSIDKTKFEQDYLKLVLLRLLQVLGAYGLRGIIEKRPHFKSSISFGLLNIAEWLPGGFDKNYPELMKVLTAISSPSFIQQFETKSVDSKLKIRVYSFSYKKGIPSDDSGNGGGFVFDCRGILNPGRFEEYKKLTGRDKPVKDFLESKTKVFEFLMNAQDLVSISIEDYIARGFEHLQISFGCTGGQHRSVYCADEIQKFIETKYGVDTEILHVEQEAKGWIN